MATFVLVHGASHGGWCWKFVAPLLQGAWHDTYTLTITAPELVAEVLDDLVESTPADSR